MMSVRATHYEQSSTALSPAARRWRKLLGGLGGRRQWWAVRMLGPSGLRMAPRDPELMLLLGLALDDADPQRSYTLFLEAGSAAVETGEPRLVLRAARLLLAMGVEARYIVEVADYIDGMQPLDEPGLNDLVNLRGRIAAGMGETDTAERLFWQAMHLDPTDPDLLEDLVRLLVRADRYDEARTIARDRVPALGSFPLGRCTAELLDDWDARRRERNV